MNSKDMAIGYAIGYNDALGKSSVEGDFRAISDNGEDSIYVNLDTSDSSGGANCAYKYFDFTESITTTTTTTVDDTTTTTENTVTFTKRIITELTNVDTEILLLKTSYDESTGEISGYTDRNDADIYIGGGAVSSPMSGNADIAAIAWVLAKNLEQANSFKLQKKAYREGLKQGVDGGADIVEEFDEEIEQDEPTGIEIEIETDEDGHTSEPFIGSLVSGLYYKDENDAYVHLWLDMSIVLDNMDNPVIPRKYTGSIVYDAYDSSGNHIAREVISDRAGNSNWYHWKSVHKNGSYQYVYSLDINGADVRGHFVDCNADGEPLHYYSYDVSPYNEDIRTIMANAVKVSNISP